ncbi:hypothetical protein [Frondihabitans australicus]|uniref:Uncharacterized protein n=1 Tax=Frondihabitans australicus TaxID=386892 RepID=A0A495IJB6_9MICO|nr:hypothetical protein [Frondihabitans australicus]RKR75381.1 hypothetical protein C8E83_2527 [Frondihabitans australicus]
MAQVAIIVNGPATSSGAANAGKAEIAQALGILLGCPVLDPALVAQALKQQTGPVAPVDGLRALSIETVLRTAGLVKAGVIVDAAFEAADRETVESGLALAGTPTPRVVEVWCGEAGGALALTPVVEVADVATVDMDALVQEISALFV